MASIRLFPFPNPHLHLNLPQGKRASDMEHPERYWDHGTEVIRWMERNGFRYLHSFAPGHPNADKPVPRVEDLTAWMLTITMAHEHRLTDEELDRKAKDAAIFVAIHYDPEAEVYKRARRGGSKSRRGPQYTSAQLKDLEGLSIAQQAHALGCSPRTVARLRKKSFQDELDELFKNDDHEEVMVEKKVDNAFEELGYYRMADGSIHIIDPDPVTMENVFDGIEL